MTRESKACAVKAINPTKLCVMMRAKACWVDGTAIDGNSKFSRGSMLPQFASVLAETAVQF